MVAMGMSGVIVDGEVIESDPPGYAAMIAGVKLGPGEGAGWTWILSDLKTILENGSAMTR